MTIDSNDVKKNHHFRLFSVGFIRNKNISASAKELFLRWYSNSNTFINCPKGYISDYNASKDKTYSAIKELVKAGYLIKVNIRQSHGKKSLIGSHYITRLIPKKFNTEFTVHLSRRPKNDLDKFELMREAILTLNEKYKHFPDFQEGDNDFPDFQESVKPKESIDTPSFDHFPDYQYPDNRPQSSNKTKVTNKVVSSSKELCQEATTFKITEKALQLLTEKNLDVEKEVKAFDKYNGHLNGQRKANASKLFELWCKNARIEPEKKGSSRVTNPLSQSYYHEHKEHGYENSVIDYEEEAYQGVVIDYDVE